MPTADTAAADARFKPDGYHYGVRFSDGSVAAYWNGYSQRERALDYRDMLRAEYPRDTFTLVRHRRGEPWEAVPEAVNVGPETIVRTIRA